MHKVWANFNENDLHLLQMVTIDPLNPEISPSGQNNTSFTVAGRNVFILGSFFFVFCFVFQISRTVQLCDWELCFHGDTFHFPKQEVISQRDDVTEDFVSPPVAPDVCVCVCVCVCVSAWDQQVWGNKVQTNTEWRFCIVSPTPTTSRAVGNKKPCNTASTYRNMINYCRVNPTSNQIHAVELKYNMCLQNWKYKSLTNFSADPSGRNTTGLHDCVFGAGRRYDVEGHWCAGRLLIYFGAFISRVSCGSHDQTVAGSSPWSTDCTLKYPK